jgi:non-ribosomal peptide synthetase component F
MPGWGEPVRTRWPVAWALAVVVLGGCAGTTRPDPAVEAAALAPRYVLSLPVRARHPIWLLQDTPGWQSGYEVRYGGDADDPAVGTVRALLFRDDGAAARAFDRLTPEYLTRVLNGRLARAPQPITYPEPLPGDEVVVLEYGVWLPPEWGEAELTAQITAVRASRLVFLIESIGIPPEDFVPAVAEMNAAALAINPVAAASSPIDGGPAWVMRALLWLLAAWLLVAVVLLALLGWLRDRRRPLPAVARGVRGED